MDSDLHFFYADPKHWDKQCMMFKDVIDSTPHIDPATPRTGPGTLHHAPETATLRPETVTLRPETCCIIGPASRRPARWRMPAVPRRRATTRPKGGARPHRWVAIGRPLAADGRSTRQTEHQPAGTEY